MSPTALGEYCLKCGAKCVITTEGAFQFYKCPKGHGVQLFVGPDPTEKGILQWPLQESDTDIPLAAPPTTVIVGSVFLIDAEFMTVVDVSNIDNPGVTRASYGSIATTHAAGAAVSIWSDAGAGTERA